MGNWVLIVFIFGVSTSGMQTARFNTEQACQQAVNIFEGIKHKNANINNSTLGRNSIAGCIEDK